MNNPKQQIDILLDQFELFLKLPDDLIKIIISSKPSLLWFLLCKRISSLARVATDPRWFRGGKPLYWCIRTKNLNSIRTLLKDPRVDIDFSIQPDLLIYLTRNRQTDVISGLLKDSRVFPTFRHHCLVKEAVASRAKDILALLLADPRFHPEDKDNAALKVAIRLGYLDMLEMLLKHPLVDPSSKDNEAIIEASSAAGGYSHIVQLLLQDPRVDPSARNNLALKKACTNGYLNIVTLLAQDTRVNASPLQITCEIRNLHFLSVLLKNSPFDPTENNNSALYKACQAGDIGVVGILITDSRVLKTVNLQQIYVLCKQNNYTHIVNMLLKNSATAPHIQTE
jgi:hypothetical protein